MLRSSEYSNLYVFFIFFIIIHLFLISIAASTSQPHSAALVTADPSLVDCGGSPEFKAPYGNELGVTLGEKESNVPHLICRVFNLCVYACMYVSVYEYDVLWIPLTCELHVDLLQ